MNLWIVIPCFNEEAVLPQTFERLQQMVTLLQQEVGTDTHLLFVDDGSSDATWELISSRALSCHNVSGMRLSANVGHQNALWAGMEKAAGHCDAMVSIDADLQDDESVILDMVNRYREGADVVLGVRKKRATDSPFKRTTANLFYRLMRAMDSNTVENHADFRLLSKRALLALLSYPERNLFLRSMVRKLGFVQTVVYYDRQERQAGQSKYPFAKMLHFSVDGITSSSTAPLRFFTLVGISMVLVSLAMILFALFRYFAGETIRGWTSLLISMWFIGGVVATGIGVIGMYIGRIYTEVKRRPRYFVAEETGN